MSLPFALPSNGTAPEVSLDKATICYRGDVGGVACAFSYQTLHVRNLRVSIEPCAQYKRAIRCVFVPKGARKERGFMETSFPSLVVLPGHVELNIPDDYGPPQTSADGMVTTRRGRGLSCDPMWAAEFDQALKASGLVPVADYRKHDPMEG